MAGSCNVCNGGLDVDVACRKFHFLPPFLRFNLPKELCTCLGYFSLFSNLLPHFFLLLFLFSLRIVVVAAVTAVDVFVLATSR